MRFLLFFSLAAVSGGLAAVSGGQYKQDEEQVNLAVNHREEFFRNDKRGAGAIVIPDLRMVVCAVPKAGSSTTRQWLLALLGNAPEDILANAWNLYPRHKSDNPMWNGAVDSLVVHPFVLREAFLSFEWTTLAIVRDPFYRSVSMFKDQISRERIEADPISREDFAKFVKEGRETGPHTGDIATFCGHRVLTYDFYINIENFEAGMRRFFDKRPNFPSHLLTTGWDLAGNPSLLVSRPPQDHTDFGEHETLLDKRERVLKRFCNQTTAALVASRFELDYRILRRAGVHFPSCDKTFDTVWL